MEPTWQPAVVELADGTRERLREDDEFVLYRDRRRSSIDGPLYPSLVVTPVREHTAPRNLRRLEHEYALRAELDPTWAVRPLAISALQGRSVLVLEDPGGELLERLVGRPMELGQFLRLAIGLSAATGRVHQLGLIHKDIKPANALVNAATGQVWLTGLITNLLASGEPLPDIQREAEAGLAFARKIRFGLVIDIITGQLRLILTLRGLTPAFNSFNDAQFDEERFEQRHLDAEWLYEESVRLAREQGFIHNEGIAGELAARFYAARGLETIAQAYLRNARYCYLRWGTDGKVRQLDESYLHLQDEVSPSRATTTIGASVEHLDLATVMRVSQAVSGEIVLGKLIDTLMRTALEHAGAQRGLLIVSHGGTQRLEAEATTSGDTITVRFRDASVSAAEMPESILHYVVRTQESVILDDASADGVFPADEYIRQNRVRSVLCLPLIKQTTLIGVLYLENNLTSRPGHEPPRGYVCGDGYHPAQARRASPTGAGARTRRDAAAAAAGCQDGGDRAARRRHSARQLHQQQAADHIR
jgi:GAF domain-containing protein